MDLQSLGHAAAIYQRDPREIKVAISAVQSTRAIEEGRACESEARASITLNGVAYFLADEIVEAIGWLAQYDAERAREKAEAANAD